MKLKAGVRAAGLQPELLLALTVAEDVFAEHGSALIITSLSDGEHHETSRHYDGCAADLRIWYLADGGRPAAAALAEALGPDYFVLVESTHIHLAWKPRRA